MSKEPEHDADDAGLALPDADNPTHPVGHDHYYVAPPPRRTWFEVGIALARTHGTRVAEFLLLGGLLVGFVAAVVILPSVIAPGDPGLTAVERISAEGGFRDSLIQGIAGMALLIGAAYTARTFRVTTDRAITERLAKAVEQLGSSKAYVRVGAIIALARIADDSKRDYPAVMSLLVTFVRGTRSLEAAGTDPARAPLGRKVETDVQAALEVLGRRRHRELETDLLRLGSLDLEGAVLRELDFSYTDFTYSFIGKCSFTEARLHDCNFFSANMSRSGFTRSDMSHSNLASVRARESYFKGADLSRCDLEDADFRSSDFSGTWVDGKLTTNAARFSDSDLTDTSFQLAGLQGVDLSRHHSLQAGQLAGAMLNDHSRLPPHIRREQIAGSKPPS